MVIAVCSDIHGDIQKLERLAQSLDKAGIPPHKTYICGDLVYTGETREDQKCMRLVSERGYNLVLGNHEDTACHVASEDFSKYLARFAKFTEVENILFSHTIPPISWGYIESPEIALGGFEYLSTAHPHIQISFVGHTHLPVCFLQSAETKKIRTEKSSRFSLPKKTRAIISPGSLKKTRKFILYDPEKSEIRRLRLKPRWNFALLK